MINLQPTLSNSLIRIEPLEENDFEALYAVANDPLLWEQHPNKERYKREVFEVFFEGALKSGSAFLIYDNASNKVIGSTRFYDLDEEKTTVFIGYTFLSRSHWGRGYNPSVKNLLLEYIFQYVDSVRFHVGALNIRSQKAMEKLGAVKIAEEEIEYYGEGKKLNFLYEIRKDEY